MLIEVICAAAPDPSVTDCPIDSFCLNGGTCLYYEFIGELVCRCDRVRHSNLAV